MEDKCLRRRSPSLLRALPGTLCINTTPLWSCCVLLLIVSSCKHDIFCTVLLTTGNNHTRRVLSIKININNNSSSSAGACLCAQRENNSTYRIRYRYIILTTRTINATTLHVTKIPFETLRGVAKSRQRLSRSCTIVL